MQENNVTNVLDGRDWMDVGPRGENLPTIPLSAVYPDPQGTNIAFIQPDIMPITKPLPVPVLVPSHGVKSNVGTV